MRRQIVPIWLILMSVLLVCVGLSGCIPGASAKISIKEIIGDKEQILNDVQNVMVNLGYRRAPIVLPADSSQTTLRIDSPTTVVIAFKTDSKKSLRVWVELRVGAPELEIVFAQFSNSFTISAKEDYRELVHALESNFGEIHVIAEDISNK